ncbi:ABC transporter permease [Granulicella sp. WH15]|uniref:ABC transporter permease n=1 Tax=Granulicella sp. WH15 TaxID=2602070 RepID=UPI0013A55E00|nr:ABC transporter permease [Granulicella sp. WH15]
MKHSYLIAINALKKNKLQTILTMVGMTIGVATVVTMIAVGSGAQNAIEDEVRAAGMNLITVQAGNYQNQRGIASGQDSAGNDPSGADALKDGYIPDRLKKNLRLGDFAAGKGAADTLSLDDADAIRKRVTLVQYVSPGLHDHANVSVGSSIHFTALHGEGTDIFNIKRAWALMSGRFFSQREEANGDHVVVIGSIVNHALFHDEDPVGKSITIHNVPFQVVGVFGSGSWMVQENTGDDQFDAVYMPVTTAQSLLHAPFLNTITVSTYSVGDVPDAGYEITDVLRERHKIDEGLSDDFRVLTQAGTAITKTGVDPEVARSMVGSGKSLDDVTLKQLAKTMDQSSRTMTVLLACIGTVSMIVGGIGIMNIMLLSVVERTREIGIRRAVGASSQDVMQQFLMESITLSLAGGVLGIIVGVITSAAITQIIKWSTSISFVSVMVSFGISAAIGIFFGYYPARKASRVSPMESLRYEAAS